jgi:sugar-specific transcriptional regulator TrmB
MGEIEANLRKIGLHASEIKVYLAILENGLSTPPQVAKATGIARTNCYAILEELRAKDLVEEQEHGKRKAYAARDPQALLISLQEKKETAEQLIPDLRALYAAQINKPKIRFYDGWEEVKQIYWASLSAEKIYGLGSTEKLVALEPGFLEKYQKQLDKKKIIFYDILTAATKDRTAKFLKESRGALHEIKFLPRKYGDAPTDMLIWKDTIALITLDAPVFGTILTSPTLYKTFTLIFDMLWEKL